MLEASRAPAHHLLSECGQEVMEIPVLLAEGLESWGTQSPPVTGATATSAGRAKEGEAGAATKAGAHQGLPRGCAIPHPPPRAAGDAKRFRDSG